VKLQCPNCGYEINFQKTTPNAVWKAIKHLERNRDRVSTQAIAVMCGYSERGMKYALDELRRHGLIDRFGQRGQWIIPSEVEQHLAA
jgi:predicted HTH transcriptional regulator